MPKRELSRSQQRGAQLRFSNVGPLLSCPPPRGQLLIELKRLSEELWRHPTTHETSRFQKKVSTQELSLKRYGSITPNFKLDAFPGVRYTR